MREAKEQYEKEANEKLQKEDDVKSVSGDDKIIKEGDTTMDIVLDNTKIEKNIKPQDKKDSSSDNNSDSFIF